MSIRMMTRRCSRCRRSYPYNPSTGDLGLVCKHCGSVQGPPPWIPQPKWREENPIHFPDIHGSRR